MDISDFNKVHTGYSNRYLERRNDLKTPVLDSAYPIYDEKAPDDQNYLYSFIKNNEQTPVSRIFFSKKNLDYLQDMIKKIVFKETGHTIGRQSDSELLIIMRGEYLQKVKNLPYDYDRQVAEINYHVIKYAVYEQILPKVKGYNIFLNDNLRKNVVLEQPMHTDHKGTKLNRGFADLI